MVNNNDEMLGKIRKILESNITKDLIGAINYFDTEKATLQILKLMNTIPVIKKEEEEPDERA